MTDRTERRLPAGNEDRDREGHEDMAEEAQP
jgi:hypothetical protein